MKKILPILMIGIISFGFDWGWGGAAATANKTEPAEQASKNAYYGDSSGDEVKAAYNSSSETAAGGNSGSEWSTPTAEKKGMKAGYSEGAKNKSTSTLVKALADKDPEKAKARADSMQRLAEALRRMSENRK